MMITTAATTALDEALTEASIADVPPDELSEAILGQLAERGWYLRRVGEAPARPPISHRAVALAVFGLVVLAGTAVVLTLILRGDTAAAMTLLRGVGSALGFLLLATWLLT